MTAFDTAWGVAKTRGFDIRDHNGEDPLGDALDAARSEKREPLPENLGGMVRTGSKQDSKPLQMASYLSGVGGFPRKILEERERNLRMDEGGVEADILDTMDELDRTVMDLNEAKRALADGDKTHSWLHVEDEDEMRSQIRHHELEVQSLQEELRRLKGDSE